MSDEIYLGEKVKDTVTGLVGIAVARCVYLNNCVQYLVQPKVIEHRIVEGYWIDESQLRIVKPPKKEKPYTGDYVPTGGGVRSHPRG